MSGISRHSFRLVAAAIGVLLLASAAHALFPKTREVADKLRKNYETLESWRADLEVNGTSGQTIRSWRKGDLWRQEWRTFEDNATRVVRIAVGSGNRIDAVRPASATVPYPPLRLAWLNTPKQEWDRLGINGTVKSYQFLEDRPCLVLGAEYKDLESSQVWIDLERDVPLKLIAPSGISWRWSEYYSLGNHLLPTRLRVAFPEGESVAFDVRWEQVATEIDRSRFNPNALDREPDQPLDSEVSEPRMRLLLRRLPPAGENATTDRIQELSLE